MKKYLLVVFVVLLLVVSGCSSSNDEQETAIPYCRLEFETIEEGSKYVGGYSIKRENLGQSWDEWGEWTKAELIIDQLLNQNHVCFGYFPPENKGYFSSAPGFSWNPCKFEGRDCICLEEDKDNN